MLNLDTKAKSKLLWVGTLLAPLIAVQGVRYLLIGDSGPVSAGAAVSPVSLVPVPAADIAKPLTPAQQKAMKWLQSRTVTLNLRSPMDRPDPVEVVATPEPVKVEPAPLPRNDDTPRNLVLNGILGGSGEKSRSLASINHRVYRVGDEIAPKWTIVSIDTRKRTVVIESTDGRVLELIAPTP